MKINWKVRIKNKRFWLTLLPAILLLAQMVLGWFNINIAADLIGEQATQFINALFVLLAILGVVEDPTVKGFSDSEQALTYSKPKGEQSYE